MPDEIKTSLSELQEKHFHYMLTPSDDPDTELEELQEYLSLFYDEHCKVEVEIPGNELRKAYNEKEIGFAPVPMPKKIVRKSYQEEAQTGDYAFKISVDGGEFQRLKIRFERKEVGDFNGTILNNWKRFYRELKRAEVNKEIEDFRIVVEGDRLQALTFFMPYPKVCKYCMNVGYRVKNSKRTYYCRIDGKDKNYNSNCSRLVLKKRSQKQIAQQIAFKRKRIGMIEAMGVPIEWCGSRGEAATHINVAVKQYFIVHYEEILGLNKGVKLAGEDRETLTFEVSGIKFKVAKDAVEVLA